MPQVKHQSVGLSIDQSQLIQINQLMSDLSKTTENNNNNNSINMSPNDSLNQTQSLLELLGGSSPLTHQNHNNQLHYQISPNKLTGGLVLEQQQQNQQSQINLFDQMGQQQQQMVNIGGGGIGQQVHTIMLNGQPALFIPASSAISSNLMSQIHMQISQNTSGSGAEQSSQASSSSYTGGIVLELANTTTTATNQLNLAATDNQKLSPNTKNITQQQRTSNSSNLVMQPQLINMSQFMSNGTTNDNTTNNIQQQYFIQSTTSNTSNAPLNDQDVIVKTENIDLSEHLQQQQQQQQQQQKTENIDPNEHLQQQQQHHQQQIIIQQSHQFLQQQSHQQPQIFCLQPDGSITLQAFQPNQPVIFQQQQHQPQIVSASQTTNATPTAIITAGGGVSSMVTTSTANTNNVNNPTMMNKIPISPYGEGRKKIVSRRHKTKTIASTLLQQQQPKPTAKTKKQNQENNSQQQYTSQMVQLLNVQQSPSSSSQQQQNNQQWIIINNPNDLTMLNGTSNNILSAMILPQMNANQNQQTTTANADGLEKEQFDGLQEPAAKKNKASKDINKGDENAIFKEIISNGDTHELDDENEFDKKKRKPCDCPNCVKLKENGVATRINLEGQDLSLIVKRTHRCHVCNKEYHKTSHLRAHLRGHDNYRPYICDFKTCGKKFTRSDELKRHMRIHVDERNFPCLICKKRFLRSDHLNKHLLTHAKSPMGINQMHIEPKLVPKITPINTNTNINTTTNATNITSPNENSRETSELISNSSN